MFTKRIDINGCTFLFNGELEKYKSHADGGHWVIMNKSARFEKILTDKEVQMVLNNPLLFSVSNRSIVWRDETVTSIHKELVMKLDYVLDDKGDPSVGIFPQQANVSISIRTSDLPKFDEDAKEFWYQAVIDFLDAPGCVKTVSEFNLEQSEKAKFES